MTLAAMKSDSQVKTDVLSELKWDAMVDETEVGVQVKDGIVTLTGNISSYPKKLAAVKAAHRVLGVLDVVDNMQVKVPSLWERSDEDIAKAVRNALRWDITVPDDRITTTVTKGMVTLQGNVDTWVQRRDAERALQRLTGVRGIVNQIVVTAKPVDSLRIKRDIEEALERQTEREVKRLGVSVADGIVTLTGSLRSWSEKHAAERVALNAHGVRRVDNKTVVDPYL